MALNNVYKDFSKCNYDATGQLICGATFEPVNSLAFTKEPERNYTYGVYGTQGDLTCTDGGIQKYIKATFNPAYAPAPRASMDAGLMSQAPVEAMPAKLFERFQGTCNRPAEQFAKFK